MKERLTEQEVIQYLRSRCVRHGDQTKLAEELKISRSYMSQILKGQRGIEDKVAAGLGYIRRVFFERV